MDVICVVYNFNCKRGDNKPYLSKMYHIQRIQKICLFKKSTQSKNK